MSLDTLLILAALGVVILLLALLLLRRPPADPMLALLQAAQERQGERLGALGGDTRAALAAAWRRSKTPPAPHSPPSAFRGSALAVW